MEERFIPIPDVSWLRDLWDGCCSATIPSPRDCDPLAWRFVGCNLIIDVVDCFASIASPAQADAPFAPGGSFAQVDSWLHGRAASPHSGNLLVTAGALRLLDDPRIPRWQRINRLLAREAICRVGRPATRTPAYERALRLLHAGVRDEPGLPRSGRVRSRRVVETFDTWWDDTAERLANLLPPWRRGALTRPEWTRLVRGQLALDPEPLSKLVRAKRQQWDLCVQERLYVLRPVPVEWFKEMNARLLHAYFNIPRLPMEFDTADVQNWVRLWNWVPQHNLGVPIPDGLPPVEQAAPIQVSPSRVPELVDTWNRIDEFLNSRRDTRAYAEDLFAWAPPPVPPPSPTGYILQDPTGVEVSKKKKKR